MVDGIVHYCVANMPGGVARTSTYALNNVTLPFALTLADDTHVLNGLNVANGAVTCEPVAKALGYEYLPAEKALAG